MDHFGEMAWKVYRVAHGEAMKLAKQGYMLRTAPPKPGDDSTKALKDVTDKLKEAYFMDAFGLHFFSDQFASGHTRDPRMELNRPSYKRKF